MSTPLDPSTAVRRVPPEVAAVQAQFAAELVTLQAKHQNEIADLHEKFQAQLAAVVAPDKDKDAK